MVIWNLKSFFLAIRSLFVEGGGVPGPQVLRGLPRKERESPDIGPELCKEQLSLVVNDKRRNKETENTAM